MVDQGTSTSGTAAAVCPWCSAALPDAAADTCPSCGANLTGTVEETLPGLTAVDPGAIVRSRQVVKPRSRLLSWLSGDDGDETFTKAEGQALEPPALDVRREMLRLELEAEVANLKAENDAILAEAAAEGRVVEMPSELAAAASDASDVADGDDEDAVAPADPADADVADGIPAPGGADAPDEAPPPA